MSGIVASTNIPAVIAMNNYTVNSARVIFPEELNESETESLANRPNVFAHADNFDVRA